MNAMSLKVLCVDDDALMRRGVCDLLTANGYQVKEAAHAEAAIDYLSWPDVVILDIKMPLNDDLNQKKRDTMGIELAEAFKRVKPETGIVLLSAYDHHGQPVLSMLRQGYNGIAYLLKGNTGPTELLNAIQQTWEGRMLLDTEVDLKNYAEDNDIAWLSRSVNLMSQLTDREMEIVDGIAQGLSGQAVADNLNLALKTVQNRLNQIYRKLSIPEGSHSPRKSLLLTRIYLAYQQQKSL